MTDWDAILKPAPVYCDGCGIRVPNTIGTEPGEGCYGEHLQTPIGRVFRRTCWYEGCIALSRLAVDGKPVKVRETGQDKVNTHLRGKR